jgi:hypothetical protein
MGEPTNYLTLTDAVIRNTTMPTGKAQHYLHDDKLPGLALRMRATGGRTWVYLFTKPGVKGTQRKTLGAWPRFNERAARKAATIAAGEVVKGVDPNDAKREAKREQLAERQCTTLATLIIGSSTLRSKPHAHSTLVVPKLRPSAPALLVTIRAAAWKMQRVGKSGRVRNWRQADDRQDTDVG